jgi:hypothetical protein
MIASSNSPVRRSGTPSQLLGVLLHTTAIFGLSRVRTESFYLLYPDVGADIVMESILPN